MKMINLKLKKYLYKKENDQKINATIFKNKNKMLTLFVQFEHEADV